jgi:hypothetical protein
LLGLPASIVAVRGKLKRGHRLARVALRHYLADAALTLAALGCHAKFELDVVEAHSGAGMTGNLSVGDTAANTCDHGGNGSSKWMGCRHYKCESLLFAMNIDNHAGEAAFAAARRISWR